MYCVLAFVLELRACLMKWRQIKKPYSFVLITALILWSFAQVKNCCAEEAWGSLQLYHILEQ